MEFPSFWFVSGQKALELLLILLSHSTSDNVRKCCCSYFQNTSGIWPPLTVSAALILVQVISSLDYCSSLLQVYLLLQLLSLQLFSTQNPKWFLKNPSKIMSLLCLRCSSGSPCQNKSQSSCIGLQDPPPSWPSLPLWLHLLLFLFILLQPQDFIPLLESSFSLVPWLTLSTPLGSLECYLLWRSVLTFPF